MNEKKYGKTDRYAIKKTVNGRIRYVGEFSITFFLLCCILENFHIKMLGGKWLSNFLT